MRKMSGFVRVLVLNVLVFAASTAHADWPRFRGPAGTGVVDGPAIPSTYSLTENLAWRTALPGKGVSSPIVHGDRVYVTAYTGYGQDLESPGDPADLVRHLLAFDRATGDEVWRFSVPTAGSEDPYKGFLTQHGYASSTPVTDGDRIYVLFGRSGLIAVDTSGKEVWRRDVGQKSDPARWGDASSPILIDDVVVVNAGVLGHQVVGLDRRTGEQLWSVQDEKFTNAWSTPAVYRAGDRSQVLVHFPFKIMGLDPRTGDVVWFAETPLDDATSPSIVVHGDVAYLTGSRAGHGMAVALGGQGDVSKSHVLWRQRLRAGIVTPVILAGTMFWSSSGIFMAYDIESGERVYRARLPRKGGPTGGFPNVDYSSPIAVGDRIVQFTRSGESYVIDAGDTFQLRAHNAAIDGDPSAFSATPAASDGQLFVRSEAYLYCFAAAAEGAPAAETAAAR
ncbi:MAG: PQQ-binding-like beta-propeller repeat protein [Acidobacteriota bacterium]